ncbi:MAG: polysaccharide pyruvyl transferase family protein [Candidatus Methanosuratincola petrocarbonis]
MNSLAAKGNSIPKLGKKYAVVYNLGFSMLPVAQKLVDELDLPVVIYQKPPLLPFRRSLLYSKYFRDSSTFYHTGPKEIMGLIKDAEFVITDSYHGALASIQFEKDFAAIMSKSINYHLTLRFTDLLKKLNLIDRIVWNSEKNRDCIGNLVNERTNYISVKKVLKELRKESIELLKMALLD